MFPPAQKPSDTKLCAVDVCELKESCALKLVLIAASRNQDERDKLSIKHLLSSMLLTVEVNLKREDCEACLCNFFIFCNEHPIYKNIYVLESSLQNFYETHIVMMEEEIVKLCCDTLGQSTCDNWFAARVLRVSASKNTHSIKTRAKKTVESLISGMLYPKKISTPATQYGSKHECDAKKEYEQIFHCDVKQIRLIVCKSNPWLCTSLDGVVIEDGCITKIVEFKCPFTCTDQPVVDYSNKKCNVSYLYFFGGTVQLRESAIYYTQCQVQMYVSGLTICDLFIYSPVTNGSCIIQVHRNETFLENIIYKCEHFYFNYYLPAVRDFFFYMAFGTRKFIASSTQGFHAALSCVNPTQDAPLRSTPTRPITTRSAFTLSSHLRLGLPTGRVTIGLPFMTRAAVRSSPILATCPAHPNLRDFIILLIFGDAYRLCNSSLCSLLHSPVSSSFFGPYIFRKTLFSNTLKRLSACLVRAHVSHPYRTTGSIIVLYILILTFLDNSLDLSKLLTA
ncbi:uncharacterized protein LOC116738656 [Nasonia vitripennis]|uniref:YqaJ viral recombinase domain-containing protein n=1 Tax=Nasonia vitripennis TaxID=7425 RepID=A0A7M7R3U9_NASVI|nr:uncharacterized protein LOC116738656 [Nasonia vitripennis]XP_032457702.1 uncharacterized protein LOC116738656 [Nasonia vitripennis]XP_032457703.1 uncharacterized protein LOC116738656 [Nasonia vitripennis]